MRQLAGIVILAAGLAAACASHQQPGKSNLGAHDMKIKRLGQIEKIISVQRHSSASHSSITRKWEIGHECAVAPSV